MFLREWMEKFVPNKEYFTHVPVWKLFYSLSLEFWLPKMLESIGNTLGKFVKSQKAPKSVIAHFMLEYVFIKIFLEHSQRKFVSQDTMKTRSKPLIMSIFLSIVENAIFMGISSETSL